MQSANAVLSWQERQRVGPVGHTSVLGITDKEQGSAVLDGAAGVEELCLGKDVAASLFAEPLEADQRGSVGRQDATPKCLGGSDLGAGWAATCSRARTPGETIVWKNA